MPIDLSNLDPNLIYITLLLGLWVSVTAAYIPGTGLAEFAALLILVASFILLAMMPTNWLAVFVLVLGVTAFLLLPFLGKRYRQFAEIGLVFQALGSFFLFQDRSISPILIAVTLILALAYHRLILLPIIHSQAANDYEESHTVIGKQGRVVKDLDPVGTVYVNKEHWRARSTDYLAKDTPIVVTGQEGLELLVEKAKRYDEGEALKRLESAEPLKNGSKAKR